MSHWDVAEELDRMKVLNAELMKALENCKNGLDQIGRVNPDYMQMDSAIVSVARAIAKAKEEPTRAPTQGVTMQKVTDEVLRSDPAVAPVLAYGYISLDDLKSTVNLHLSKVLKRHAEAIMYRFPVSGPETDQERDRLNAEAKLATTAQALVIAKAEPPRALPSNG